MLKRATIDDSGKYRYTLERRWGADPANFVNFILLNPSTADETKDDPTVRACIEFARRWGFDGLVMTNLFAFRATAPSKMRACNNPHGDLNDQYIKRVAKKAALVVVAWGNHGSHCGRDKEVMNILTRTKKPHCLSITKAGQPKHPLYVKRNTKSKPYGL